MGVLGVSRGGSASLRIAALAPEPLKAVVVVCRPDGRHENERHDPGGSAVAARMEAPTPALHTTGPPLALVTVKVAVPAVGGWYDPYHGAVLRLVEHLPHDRVRGSIGPWSHHYPRP